jgi:HD-like signal output (HDOD) protein
LYGRRGNVSSIRYAVSLLGVNKLRNAALSMSVTRMWNKMRTPTNWSMQNFNRHALAVAMLADVLSQEALVDNPEGAFVGGLLHDLGKLIIAVCLTPEYAQIESLIGSTGRTPLECEEEVLGTTHAGLSGDALRIWGLPEPIEAAVRCHHHPGLASSPHEAPGVGLSYAIATSDEYVNQLGWGLVGYAQPCEKPSVFPIHALGINDVQRVLDLFHEEFDSVSAFL